MNAYLDLERASGGVLFMRYRYVTARWAVRVARQVWRPCVLRKTRGCVDCKQEIPAGSNAYRPVTSLDNRMHRMCHRCARVRIEVLKDYGKETKQ